MSENNTISIPDGWALSTLEDITEIILGQSPPSSTYNDTKVGLPFYQGKLEFGDLYPTPQKWCSDPHKIAKKGDILISVRAPVGDTNLCPEISCIGRGLAAIRCQGGMPSRFVLYYLRSVKSDISAMGTGTTFKAINGKQLREVIIPIPSLPEQHRIVAKIEELFTQLDAGVAALTTALAQLKRYRQSVLKAAFEGKLTEEWRERHPDVEPADMLLDAIEKESNRLKKKKAVNQTQNCNNTVPNLWKYATIEQVSEKIVDCLHSTPKFGCGEYACVDTTCISDGKLLIEKLRYVDYKTFCERNRRLIPKCGDIIFAREGTVGTVVSLPDSPKVCLGQRVMLIRPSNRVISKYVQYALMSPQIRDQYMPKLLGSTVPHVNVGEVVKFNIPISPFEEQNEIVAEIERRFTIIDETEKAIRQSLTQSEHLRQSILKRAFEGKLVPQDPDDEPASFLLERIKKEKAAQKAAEKAKKKTKRSKKNKTTQQELI